MFVQLVHINIKPGRLGEFFKVWRINYEGTIKEPGNFRFDTLQDPNDENHFIIYEVFDSAEAVDAHRETEHYALTVAGLEGLMVGARTKDFYKLVMPDAKDRADV